MHRKYRVLILFFLSIFFLFSEAGANPPLRSESPLFEAGSVCIKLTPSAANRLQTKMDILAGQKYQVVRFGIASLDDKAQRLSVLSISPRFLYHLQPERISGADLPDISRIYRLRFSPEIDPFQAAHFFSRDPHVEYAEPIPIGYPLLIPNDSLYVEQQHLPQIMAEQAWDIHRGEEGEEPVIVAIVDSGVEWTHPDLADNIWRNEQEIPDNGVDDDNNGYIDDVRGWDFLEDDNDPDDPDGHGTFTSGIASACTDNGIGVAAVGWNLKIMPVRGFMYQGIVYAAENGAHIVSNSWGTATYSQAGQDAIDYATGLGSIVIASAGNGDTDALHYPSAHAHVLSVASVDENDFRAPYTHYGISIDLCAPGGDGSQGPGPGILSTAVNSSYTRADGTSAAAPLAAGLCGLIKSYRPEWNQERVIAQLQATCDNIDSLNPDYVGMLGSGRINAYRALSETFDIALFPLRVRLADVEIHDDNQNGLIEPGETADLSITLQNFSSPSGDHESDQVTAFLSSEDENVEIITGESQFILASDDFTRIENEFRISVHPQATARQVQMRLDLQADLPILHGESLSFTLFIGTGRFHPITESPVAEADKTSYGNNWIDYDNDGLVDLFNSNGSSSTEETSDLYRNNGDGTFIEITDNIAVSETGLSYCSSWADYDNDGFIDLFISNTSHQDNYLYRNLGGGDFLKIEEGEIVQDGAKSDGCSWADYDNDGYVDLFVANLSNQHNFLYHNNQNGEFHRMTDTILFPQVGDGGKSNGCAWADFNNDGYVDLFVANASDQDNRLYLNQMGERFISLDTSEPASDGSSSLGGSWGDYDNDGDLDLFVTNGADQNNMLYINQGDSLFFRPEDATSYPMITDQGASGGAAWGDYNNDGSLDLYVANRNNQNNFLYRNNGDGSFLKITDEIIVNTTDFSVSCSWADYDRDGNLDLFVANGGQNALYRNQGTGNHWVNIRCVGVTSNRSAIGTKARIKAEIYGESVWQMREISAQTGYAGQNSLLIHFGLGDASVIDSLRIEWSSGAVDIHTEISRNQFLTAVEGEDQLAVENVATGENLSQLLGNYPNPFGNGQETSVGYQISVPARATMIIYNIAGQAVRKISELDKPAGYHTIQWDGSDQFDRPLGSGIYFYRLSLTADGKKIQQKSGRMVFIK